MGSSSADCRARTTCSLGSHFSSGTNHQLKIAKMVTAPKMTPAYDNGHRIDQQSTFAKKNNQIANQLTKLNVSAVTGKKKGET